MEQVLDTEFCVVGAGPAGAALASQLAAAGKRVLVVEQGGDYGPELRAHELRARHRDLQFGGDYDAAWPTAFKNAIPTSAGADAWRYSSVSGLGGTSLHWSAATPRPRSEDMRVGTLYGRGRDWPISYAELEPWLLAAEREIGVAAAADNPYASPRSAAFPMPPHPFCRFEREVFAPAVKSLGWHAHSRPNGINSVKRQGRSACLACRACSACPSGARYAADLVHIPRLMRAPTATLRTGLKLRRLEVSPDGRRVVRAHAVSRRASASAEPSPSRKQGDAGTPHEHSKRDKRADGSDRLRPGDYDEVAIRADVFALAMGGVETPRMLMLSADDRHHPNGLGNAGGQLGRGFSDHLITLFSMILPQPVGRSLGFPAMSCDHHRAHIRRDRHSSFYLDLYPSPVEGDWIASELFTRSAGVTRGDTLSLGAMRAAMTRGAAGMFMHEMSDAHQLTLDPDVADEFGDPVPRLSVSLTEWEKESANHSLWVLADMAGAFGAEIDAYWERGKSWFASHPSGATAMGATPADGVCDPQLRVFGLENLFIVSSSVFPHNGANNPTLTAVALSLRLASHLGAA